MVLIEGDFFIYEFLGSLLWIYEIFGEICGVVEGFDFICSGFLQIKNIKKNIKAAIWKLGN